MHFLKHDIMVHWMKKYLQTLQVHNLASKKFVKGKQKWNKTCVDFGFSPKKFYSLLKIIIIIILFF
jgi:hypothetical protein